MRFFSAFYYHSSQFVYKLASVEQQQLLQYRMKSCQAQMSGICQETFYKCYQFYLQRKILPSGNYLGNKFFEFIITFLCTTHTQSQMFDRVLNTPLLSSTLLTFWKLTNINFDICWLRLTTSKISNFFIYVEKLSHFTILQILIYLYYYYSIISQLNL